MRSSSSASWGRSPGSPNLRPTRVTGSFTGTGANARKSLYVIFFKPLSVEEIESLVLELEPSGDVPSLQLVLKIAINKMMSFFMMMLTRIEVRLVNLPSPLKPLYNRAENGIGRSASLLF